jgi:hypothetical protein
MGPKTLPTIWGTYMKLVTKYQISAINNCWEKCAYIFNVYKNQLSRQTGSRNLMGSKTLPTIWYTYMTLVTKYQISANNSYWEKCNEKYLGQTNRGKTVYPPPPSGSGGIKKQTNKNIVLVCVHYLINQLDLIKQFIWNQFKYYCSKKLEFQDVIQFLIERRHFQFHL